MNLPEYLETLKNRASQSRVYKKYQSTGLELAQLLDDKQHVALYIKLAKTMNEDLLIQLAKDISQRDMVKNKGAYFMKMLKEKKRT